MVDASLATVEAATLTQGVAFLYAQAGDLLKRRREARDRAAAAGAADATAADMPLPRETPAPPPVPENTFESTDIATAEPVPEVLDRLAGPLLDARRNVDDYILGSAMLGPGSIAALQAVDQLRRILEEIYSADLTFRGERRVAGTGASIQIDASRIGVNIAGSAIVHGDIAGHTINKFT